jgi:uncharacterized membrane protein
MRKLALAGLFVAMGLVLPMAFHSLGLGRAFLPMHIPVMLAGIYLDWRLGIAVGVVTPVLSSVLTAMPAMPMALTMVFELSIYAVIAGAAYRRTRNGLLSVAAAAFAGRLVYGFVAYLLFPLLGLTQVAPFYPITTGLVTGLPGVAVQLVLIPLLLLKIKPEREI